jgi:transcriptional regulator with XRE-family HTH domain
VDDAMADKPAPVAYGERLSHYIATIHPPDRGPYSLRELAAGVKSATGVAISSTQIHRLATGAVLPSLLHAEAIAQFFGVPLDSFTDRAKAEQIDAELDEVTAWRDEEARDIAQRAMRLGPAQRAILTNLMESLENYAAAPPEKRARRKSTG